MIVVRPLKSCRNLLRRAIINVMKKFGFVVCSDAQKRSWQADIKALKEILEGMDCEVVFSPYLYGVENCKEGSATRSALAQERAEALMQLYQDERVDAIFDISGGDIANEILPYLDYEMMRERGIPFFGYSDLTTVINAIYTKTGVVNGLWQIKNIVWDTSGVQKEAFSRRSMPSDSITYRFLRGNCMKGILVGGNIRCFLKLAGTPYFPDLTDKILLLEAKGGTMNQMITYLSQLKQLGVFEKVNGILLGTFSEIEELGLLTELKKEILDIAENVSVAITKDVGHGVDAKCAWIGKWYCFKEENC